MKVNGEHLNSLPVPFDLYQPNSVRNAIRYSQDGASGYGNRNWMGNPLLQAR